MEICSVGKSEESKGASPNCKGLLLDRGAFSEEDLRLIRARSGIKKKKQQACEGHKNMYLKNFIIGQKLCCNPFDLHTSSTKSKKKGMKGS